MHNVITHGEGRGEVIGDQSAESYPWIKGRTGCSRLRGDGAPAQFVRFVLVGGSSNLLYALVFFLLHSQGTFAANVAGVVVSTALANELHRRLTFHASARVHWFPAQWEGGGLALVGLVLSTVSLALLDFWLPSAGGAVQAVLVVVVSALVGVFRFLALRGWVFSKN
ncbi:GtrA family protein [Rhodococcus sp. NPDC058514]|uniref:GtrA family protein n=1 Tax=unclassified Rhodococcus (in: high G+C Gram-positive bacteria) TaxID=192944 RepID=UPI00364FA087